MNERDLVGRIRELFSPRIGDDAAVVDGQVFTTDMLVENVDFTRSTPLHVIARKSLAVNLSDLASMGARPLYALLALALPPWALDGIEEMLQAYAAAAREHSIEIIGGDVSRSDQLCVSITAIGQIVTRALLRSGGKPGDRIYVSRPLGASSAGLIMLQKGIGGSGYAERELVQSMIHRHLDPEPELALGQALAAMPEVTACIDVSDGLSTDLHHLCESSKLGARIEKERIPIFPDLMTHAQNLGIDLRDCVLNGGEEYALLFTSTLTESEISRRAGRPLYAIGRMTSAREVVLVEESVEKPLPARGWDHFSPS